MQARPTATLNERHPQPCQNANKPKDRACHDPTQAAPPRPPDGCSQSARKPLDRQVLRPGPPGAYWLYGAHAVSAALANPRRRWRRLVGLADALAELTASMGREPADAERLDRAAIAQLLPPDAVHQGLALLVEPLTGVTIEELAEKAAGQAIDAPATIVVLDQVTDPHNVGAILRSAAAFGALGLVMTDRHAPEESGSLAKAASGGLEIVPIARIANLSHALEVLKRAGYWSVGLAAEGERSLAQTGLSGRIALVLGSEGRGLRRLTRERCDHIARLPTTSAFGQLNVSAAAAIALYEFARNS